MFVWRSWRMFSFSNCAHRRNSFWLKHVAVGATAGSISVSVDTACFQIATQHCDRTVSCRLANAFLSIFLLAPWLCVFRIAQHLPLRFKSKAIAAAHVVAVWFCDLLTFSLPHANELIFRFFHTCLADFYPDEQSFFLTLFLSFFAARVEREYYFQNRTQLPPTSAFLRGKFSYSLCCVPHHPLLLVYYSKCNVYVSRESLCCVVIPLNMLLTGTLAQETAVEAWCFSSVRSFWSAMAHRKLKKNVFSFFFAYIQLLNGDDPFKQVLSVLRWLCCCLARCFAVQFDSVKDKVSQYLQWFTAVAAHVTV